MAQIKKTKIELKNQRDALRRYQRYLPMLQLKKQQLQLEVQHVEQALVRTREEAAALKRQAASWLALFSEASDPSDRFAGPATVALGEDNIAGVAVPRLDAFTVADPEHDLFATPAWYDEAYTLVAQLTERRARQAILEAQIRHLSEELRITSQRVNLFEKIMIPRCKETIRIIKVYLGDLLTADIARGKAAKKATQGAAGT
jgi:V/A-type H+-transporting ATPase subunit D